MTVRLYPRIKHQTAEPSPFKSFSIDRSVGWFPILGTPLSQSNDGILVSNSGWKQHLLFKVKIPWLVGESVHPHLRLSPPHDRPLPRVHRRHITLDAHRWAAPAWEGNTSPVLWSDLQACTCRPKNGPVSHASMSGWKGEQPTKTLRWSALGPHHVYVILLT